MAEINENQFYSVRGDILKAILDGVALGEQHREILDTSIENPILTCFCRDDVTEHPRVSRLSAGDQEDFLNWLRRRAEQEAFDFKLFRTMSDLFDDGITGLLSAYFRERSGDSHG
jgi:hypothetical protein